MWEGIEDGQASKSNLFWLVQGMKSDSLLWVTDEYLAESDGLFSVNTLAKVLWAPSGKCICRQALTEQSFLACARSIY